MTYAGWNVGSPMTASLSHSRTVSELRKENGAYRILSRGEAIDHIADGRPLPLHPLCGGAPPALAWRYLRTAAEASAEATRFA